MDKLSKKIKRRTGQTRDAPTQRSVAMCSQEMWHVLCGDGYKPITSCPEVQICIGVYADLIANMTIHLMENGDDGDVRIKNELSRKMDIEPSRYMTHQSFMGNLVRVLMTKGNQVTVPEYDIQTGLLRNLWPVPPSKVNFANTQDGYQVVIGGKVFEPEEVLHFTLNPDPERPWIGTGYTATLGDVVKSLRQAGATKQALLENPMPSIIVKVAGYQEDLQTEEGRESMSKRYIESSKQGRPWLMNADAFEVQQVKPLSIADLAIKDSMELDKRSIAAIMGLPPFLVGIGEFNATYFNWFVSNKLMAIARGIEQVLTKGLLYNPGWYWRFNSRSLLNYDFAQLSTVAKDMVDRMALRRNEWRDWMGLAPDSEMEELLALENFVPADRLGDQAKLVGGEKK